MIEKIEELMKILPQKYPFLMIDRVIELNSGKSVTALKNVTINDWFFEGHFPGNPVMPGTLIIEAMAQTSILLYHSGFEDKLTRRPDYYLGSVKARFHQPAVPGDQLRLVAETVKLLSSGAFVSAKAFVGDKLIAEADLVFAVKQ
jgi:3-hydroxyacyl-[acyl-carrier-protein] dehydratase